MKAKMKNPSAWSGLLLIEKNIILLFFGIPIIYFLAQVFIKFVLNFLTEQGFVRESFDAFIHDVLVIWQYHVGTYFIFATILCIFGVIFTIVYGWRRQRPELKLFPAPTDKEEEAPKAEIDPKLFRHWREAILKANTGSQENIKSAIIEADAIVDRHLQNIGLVGETMAERLSKINKTKIKSVEKLWNAHKLRNELVHTPGMSVSAKKAQSVLLAYREFLKETNAF